MLHLPRRRSLYATAAAGASWLVPSDARRARRVDVAVAVVLLMSAAYYAYRLLDGQVFTTLPGGPEKASCFLEMLGGPCRGVTDDEEYTVTSDLQQGPPTSGATSEPTRPTCTRCTGSPSAAEVAARSSDLGRGRRLTGKGQTA